MYLGGSRHFLALRRTGMMSPKETEEVTDRRPVAPLTFSQY